MLPDPQSVTISTVPHSLPKISQGPELSVYRKADADVTIKLQNSHAFKKRNRVVSRLSTEKFADDPLTTGNSILAGATSTFTIDFPNVGMTNAEVLAQAKAHVAYLSDALLAKIIGGET